MFFEVGVVGALPKLTMFDWKRGLPYITTGLYAEIFIVVVFVWERHVSFLPFLQCSFSFQWSVDFVPLQWPELKSFGLQTINYVQCVI